MSKIKHIQGSVSHHIAEEIHALNSTLGSQPLLTPCRQSMFNSLLTSLFPVPCLYLYGTLLPTYTDSLFNHLSALAEF